MNAKRFLAGLLSAAMLSTALPAALAAEPADPAATRGQVCAMLLTAADDYNPGVKQSDILHGDPDGNLRENDPVTRAEALIMLQRAFGELPKPTGDNARKAYPASSFTDIPAWAQAELQGVFDAGIVAGTSATAFSPDENVTVGQMELFIRRVFALEGSNQKDDFYATVNKSQLDSSVIKPGRQVSGTLYNLMDKSNADVAAIIGEITADGKTYAKGTREQKISTLYHNILDWDARNKAGIAPIKPYLDAIDAANSFDDLMAVRQKVADGLGAGMFVNFSLSADAKDSTRYILHFGGMSPSLNKNVYTSGGKQKDAFMKYVRTLYMLGGLSEEEAAREAGLFWQLESTLSAAQYDRQEYGDIDKIYNIYTMQQLRDLFPAIDLDAVLAQSGLKAGDAIMVNDPGLLEANASLMNDEHLDALKAAARLTLLSGYGGTLNREFLDAANTYQQEFLGTEGTLTDEEVAAQVVQSWMPEYLGKLYVDRHFSQKAKDDVTNMVKDVLSIYKERIQKLDWMGDATKAKAIRKLDTMNIKVGYPDSSDSLLDGIDIRGAADGGSYFDNLVAISKANREHLVSLQGKPVDKTQWGMYPYTVNAMYNPMSNDITFPAGILQAPMYDVDAPREQNLGAIGYVIAHEITHAFDNNGAKFDEKGNAADWWTPEDYAAFQKLCDQAVAFYDGQEAAPGIVCNGTLTLSENIADLGAAACITEAAGRLDNPDYSLLFTSMANVWASTSSRDYALYAARADVHAPDKLRGNRVLQSLDQFYTTFGITDGDGMYLAPEDRITIW